MSSRLVGGDQLRLGQSLRSPNGQCQLAFQPDSNLVIYDNNRAAVWTTHSQGSGATLAAMQGDGNLVLYKGSTAVWNTHTYGKNGAAAYLGNDCVLRLVQANNIVWSSNESKTPNVSAENPLGVFDSVTSPTDGQLRVRGWAFDPSDPGQAVDIHVYVNGRGHNLNHATGTRTDVERTYVGRFPNMGANHGFDQTFSTSQEGTLEVCAFAIDFGLGSNKALGCKGIGGDPTPAPAPAPAAQKSELAGGERLNPGQSLWSPNGQCRTAFQGDGNLVTYKGSTAVWTTHTQGSGATLLAMQGDGNLVLYKSGEALWSTATYQHSGSTAVLGNDCVLRINSSNGTLLWDTTNGAAPAAAPTPVAGDSVIDTDEWFRVGQTIRSANGACRLAFQPDDQVVIYGANSKVEWTPHTQHSGADAMIMQGDGNLVIYKPGGAVWASGTSGTGATATLGNDCVLRVETKDGTLLWDSKNGKPAPPPPATPSTPANPVPSDEHDCSFNDECAQISPATGGCESVPPHDRFELAATGEVRRSAADLFSVTYVHSSTCQLQTLSLFPGEPVQIVGESATRWFITVLAVSETTPSNPGWIPKTTRDGFSNLSTLEVIDNPNNREFHSWAHCNGGGGSFIIGFEITRCTWIDALGNTGTTIGGSASVGVQLGLTENPSIVHSTIRNLQNVGGSSGCVYVGASLLIFGGGTAVCESGSDTTFIDSAGLSIGFPVSATITSGWDHFSSHDRFSNANRDAIARVCSSLASELPDFPEHLCE